MLNDLVRKYHKCGYLWSGAVSGDVYCVGGGVDMGGVEYVMTREGVVYKRSRETQYNLVPVDDPAILRQLDQWAAEDGEINRARVAYAVEVARGGGLLARAIQWHLEFTGGVHKEPLIREGIVFYQVGRNATHEFFIGTRDGKQYIYSCGEEEWDEEQDMPICAEQVRVVEDWTDCYLGYF